jgi:hypothetical protein
LVKHADRVDLHPGLVDPVHPVDLSLAAKTKDEGEVSL